MVNTFKPNQSILPFEAASTRFQQIKRILWQILGINLLVAGAKVMVGLSIGSLSMVADGFHSILDASSNVLGLIGSTLAARPPDANHPYGHQKFETFATLGIGLLLLLAGWNVLKGVLARFMEGSIPEVTGGSFVILIITLMLNIWVARYERRQGQRLKSSLLLADAAHTKSDIFVSLSVLASLAAVKLGWLWVDAVVALLIIVVIGHTGWQIARDALQVLTDCAVVETTSVEQVALSVAGVQSCHKIRSRGTHQAPQVDLHIQVDGDLSLREAHQLGHLAQDQLKKELGLADVIVHVEPVEPTPNP